MAGARPLWRRARASATNRPVTTHLRLEHVFDTNVDTFWEKVFFDEEYNRRLYGPEALKYKQWKLLSLDRKPDGGIARRALMEPPFEAPAVVKKLLGDGITYTEDGTFDPVAKRWRYKIIPSKLADKFTSEGEYWLEPRGDKQLLRICTVKLEVRVFGVGGAVEGFIEKQTKESYEVAARFTNGFIREKGL
jgi:hypothetical protein